MSGERKRPKVTIRVRHADDPPADATSINRDEVAVVVDDVRHKRDLRMKVYPAVGHCIYCSCTTDLRREHIVPLGLDGTAFLRAASCRVCARTTSAFEAHVLRGPMRAVRVLRQLRSRSKHRGAPTTAVVTIVRDGQAQRIALPLAEYPILLSFPQFPPPRLLTGEAGSGIAMNGVFTVSFGANPEDVARRLGAEQISVTGDYRPVSFARMLAKIAYSFAFAEGELRKLEAESLLLSSIRGDVDDIGRWVGTLDKPISRYPGLLHRLAIHEDRDRGLLIAEVQLFADSETPSYGVILGPLKPAG